MALINKSDKSYYQNKKSFGGYQYTDFKDIVNGFLISYVGEGKIISKVGRSDVSYHAQRGLQELSYDTFKSIKAQEIELPANLTMILPKDYVNYVKIASIDSSGIEHRLYPTKDTSNPFKIKQRSNGEYDFDRDDDGNDDTTDLLHSQAVSVVADATSVSTVIGETGEENVSKHITLSNFTTGAFADLEVGMEILSTVENSISIPSGMYITSIDSTNSRIFYYSPSAFLWNEVEVTFVKKESTSWGNYKSNKTLVNTTNDYLDNIYDETYDHNTGQRYGLDPQYAQVNGSFYIDENAGRVHFSSGLSGLNIVLRYISDSLGTEEEMKIHKFAEEALYKYIAHAVLASKANVPEYLVNRFKKEAFAAKRQAKLRLSNFKIEEFTQILRGKSKQIKH